MSGDISIIILGLAGLAVAGILVFRPLCRAARENRFAETRRLFHRERERLEAKFIRLVQARSRADSLRWADCEFDDDVSYVRNRSSGELSAFVALNVAVEDGHNLEPGEGGDATETLRAATAVFRFDGKHWETEGRAIFNLRPSEAIRFYHRDIEVVGQEFAQRE